MVSVHSSEQGMVSVNAHRPHSFAPLRLCVSQLCNDSKAWSIG